MVKQVLNGKRRRTKGGWVVPAVDPQGLLQAGWHLSWAFENGKWRLGVGRVFQAEEMTGTKVSVSKSMTVMRKSGSRVRLGREAERAMCKVSVLWARRRQ